MPVERIPSDTVIYHPEDCSTLFDFNDYTLLDQLQTDLLTLDDYPLSQTIELDFNSDDRTTHPQSCLSVSPVPTTHQIRSPQLPFSSISTSPTPGMPNLEEVPMEMASSDEETTATTMEGTMNTDYTALFKKLFQDSKPADATSFTDYAAELDEVELRSRALRSLLLQKKTSDPVIIQVEDADNANEKTITSSQSDCLSHCLLIGAKKNQTNNQTRGRFVIPIALSSDSEDDVVLASSNSVALSQSQPLLKSPSINKSRVAKVDNHVEIMSDQPVDNKSSSPVESAQLTTQAVRKQKVSPPTTENIETRRQILAAKLNLMRFNLTVKHRQRVVNQRKKEFSKVAKECIELNQQLKAKHMLRRHTRKLLSQAERTLSNSERSAAVARVKYSQLCRMNVETKVSDQTKRSNSKTDPLGAHKRTLMLSLLEVLQQARICTAFFNYYRLDHLYESHMTRRPEQCKPNLTAITEPALDKPVISNPNTSRVDPSLPICPFLLDGKCEDSSCTFQHPVFRQQSANESATTTSTRLSIQKPTTPPSVESNSDNETCIFCRHQQLNNSELDQKTGNNSIHAWHTFYRVFYERDATNKNNKRLSLVLKQSLKFVRQSDNDPTVIWHHLCLVCRMPIDSIKEHILDGLKLAHFSYESCRLVFRNPSLSSLVRRQLSRACVDYLLTQVGSTMNEGDNILFGTLIYCIYHLCRLLLEEDGFSSVSSLLDDYLKSMPTKHPVRCGVWWLKLYLKMHSTRLPTEDCFFSLTNLPAISKAVLSKHKNDIECMAIDMDIPNSSIDFLDGLAEQNSRNPITICYLANVYLYIQTLISSHCLREAAQFCLKLATTSPLHSLDDLFFPIAIYALFHDTPSSQPPDWSSVLDCLPIAQQSKLTISFRIEFGFLVALLLCSQPQCSPFGSKAVLIETLAGLIFLPSDEDREVMERYEELLGLNGIQAQPDALLALLTRRGSTYLWCSYCLFGLLTLPDSSVSLEHLLGYCQNLVISRSFEEHVPFDRLVLHMFLIFYNRATSRCTDRKEYLQTLLFKPSLPVDRSLLPSWFIELVQNINLSNIPSSDGCQSLCVSLVEVYGSQLIPVLCRCLLALGDHFFSQSLCSIASLDRPDDENVWMLYAGLVASGSTSATSKKDTRTWINQLTELFADAVQSVPSSSLLWKQYAQSSRLSGASDEQLMKRAKQFQMDHRLATQPNLKPVTHRTPSTPSRSVLNQRRKLKLKKN